MVGYRTVQISDILHLDSTHCNTRINGLVSQEDIQAYAARMRDGAPFDAVALHEAPAGMYDNLGGFHRARAVREAGANTVYALIVSGLTPVNIALARVALNVANGRREDTASVIGHAVELVLDHSKGQRVTAELLGVSPSALGRHVAAEAARRRGAAANVGLAGAQLGQLVAISRVKSEQLFVALAHVVRAAGKAWPAEAVEARVKEVIALHDRDGLDAALALAEKARDGYGAARNSPNQPHSPVRTNFFRALAAFKNCAMKLGQMDDFTLADWEEIFVDWTALSAHMTQLLAAGVRPRGKV